jgi:hypothetical protein
MDEIIEEHKLVEQYAQELERQGYPATVALDRALARRFAEREGADWLPSSSLRLGT